MSEPRICECDHLATSHPRGACVVDGCACTAFAADPRAGNPRQVARGFIAPFELEPETVEVASEVLSSIHSAMKRPVTGDGEADSG